MRTTYDIIDILFSDVKEAGIRITGGLYKYERPINSKMEDIVINCLPISANQNQRAVANVNVFVPDLGVQHHGKPNKLPDHKRMNDLSKALYPKLKEKYEVDYSYILESQSSIMADQQGQHYINFRIQFTLFNTEI